MSNDDGDGVSNPLRLACVLDHANWQGSLP